MTDPTDHSAHDHEGVGHFLSTYVFSRDHKTIGLQLAFEGRGARVTAIKPCAREAANLVRVGDFIATINVRPVSEYDRYELRALLAGALGAARLSIVRSGRLYNVTIPVVEAVP